MNIVDKAIAYFNPEAGVKRIYQRSYFDKMSKRSFEAGGFGRRTKSMKGARTSGPNTDIGVSMVTLRNRSRHFVQNNGWAKRAVGVIKRKTVGQGIRPAPSIGTKNQLAKAKKLWADWAGSTDCDFTGQMTFYGMQQLIMGEIAEAGDCIIVRRRVADSKLPIQLQVLEGDYIDHQRNGVNENGYARLGVQFDKTGRKTGYWIYTQHPSEEAISWTGFTSEFIPKEDVILAYEVLRAGQVRGIPHGVSCFIKMSDFSDYEDAQLMRQKIAAAFAGFITGHQQGENAEDLTERIEPGIIQYLDENETITFSNPPAT